MFTVGRLTIILPLAALLLVGAALGVTVSRRAEAGNPPPVTSTDDDGPGSLRQAIAGAGPNDTITFDPSLDGQTITLESTLAINQSLTITGPGNGVTIDGNGSSATLSIVGNIDVNISRVAITGGNTGLTVVSFAELTLTDARIANNDSDFGALYVGDQGVAILNRVAIVNNTSAGDGSAVIVADGGVNLTNVTISGNTSQGAGPAILVATLDGMAATVDLNNVTISDNTSANPNGHGAVEATSSQGTGTVRVRNSIIANQDGDLADCSVALEPFGTWESLGHNIDSDGTCQLDQDGDQPNTDPQLQPLAVNPPGFTETHSFLLGAPPKDSGDDSNCPATDQRGVLRAPHAPCDIGAFELPNGAIATPSPSPSPSPTPELTPPPTASPTPTPSPSPTAPPVGSLVWGDTNCQGGIRPDDALLIVKFVAEAVSGLSAASECPTINTALNSVWTWGNTDCYGEITMGDAMLVLGYFVRPPVDPTPFLHCPLVGETIVID